MDGMVERCDADLNKVLYVKWSATSHYTTHIGLYIPFTLGGRMHQKRWLDPCHRAAHRSCEGSSCQGTLPASSPAATDMRVVSCFSVAPSADATLKAVTG